MRSCETCGTSLEGRRHGARFCSSACRARAHQAGLRAPSGPSEPAGTVYATTLAELEAAGCVDHPDGAAALALAARIDSGRDPGAGLAALARQLTASRAAALSHARPTGSLLDELKARRDAKRSA